jgi:hypothetical protein
LPLYPPPPPLSRHPSDPAAPAHQIKSYYRDGTADDCSLKIREFYYCMRASLKDSKESNVPASAMTLLTPQEWVLKLPRNAASVWEYRDEPPAWGRKTDAWRQQRDDAGQSGE